MIRQHRRQTSTRFRDVELRATIAICAGRTFLLVPQGSSRLINSRKIYLLFLIDTLN